MRKYSTFHIPNLRQPPESTTCGPYCVLMLTSALGINASIEDLEQICNQTEDGTIETSLTLGLIGLGVNATIYAPVDGQGIPCSYLTKSPSAIRKSLHQKARHIENLTERQGYLEMAELVGKGAASFTLPTRKVIQQKIDEGCAWILGVSMVPLYLEKAEQDEVYMHYVIVQNYNDDKFEVNDPSHEHGGVYWIDKDQLLYSLYSVDGLSICVEMSYVEETV